MQAEIGPWGGKDTVSHERGRSEEQGQAGWWQREKQLYLKGQPVGLAFGGFERKGGGEEGWIWEKEGRVGAGYAGQRSGKGAGERRLGQCWLRSLWPEWT